MYRFLEILPGALSWLTLLLVVLLSWKAPVFAAIFIILFDVYWLLKTVYLSFHLRSTFNAMRKNLKVNWFVKLKELERDANDANAIRMPRIIEKELSYRLNGILFRVHNKLGRFCRERQYGDALAEEFRKEGTRFKRESPIEVAGRKSNFMDFVVEGKVAIELKAKSFVDKQDYYQAQRYLQAANLKLGFIVNFRERHLKPKRVINPTASNLETFVDSHGFVDSHRVSWEDIYHLVIFPMFQEPYEVVRESFESLLKANYPKDKFIVVLATEEHAGDVARATARRIEQEFGNKFYKFLVTVHPRDLPGEIRGKGSNETWAGKEVKRRVIDPLRIPHERILVSVFDVDTQVFPEYFGRLTYVFLKSKNRLRAVYQPIPFFTNNIYQAPAFARVVSFSTTFWQMMQQACPERLTTFSSQSLPFKVLVDIDFWQRDAVSEDSRVFWQGFLRYHGDFRVEPLAYPVSMDANVAPTFFETMKNLYRQQRRWAWGAENIAYALSGFLRDPKIPRGKKWYWSFHQIEGFHSWATNSLIIFAMGWLPVLIGGEAFGATLLSYNLPKITRFIVQLSMMGIATSAIVGIMLLPPRPLWFGKRHYAWYFLQWILIPVTLILFGAIPALEAQTRLMLGGKHRLGFWVTPKSR